MKLSAELTALSERIGHRFKDPEILIRAMTHASISTQNRPDNERLEFLGDRVLGLVMAEAVLSADTSASEGQLAPRYNALVRREMCAEVARSVDLGAALRLGRSEMMSGGRRKEALLANAMEALIAAVYLDAGYETARTFILRLWGERIQGVDADARDPKTAIQEWAQARKLQPPRYVEVARSGPDHAPVFTIEAQLATGQTAQAQAGSKRQAEQDAARQLLAAVAED